MPTHPSISSRKRSRENETPSQRHKREKAAERQRRKRERDRQAGLSNILSLAQHVQQGVLPPQPPQQQQQQSLSQAQMSGQQVQTQPTSLATTAGSVSVSALGGPETSVPAPTSIPDYSHTSTASTNLSSNPGGGGTNKHHHHHHNNNNPHNSNNSDELTPDEHARRERVRAAARERQRKHRALVKQKKMRELGLDMGNEIMPGMEDVGYRITAEGAYQNLIPHEIAHPGHPGHPHPGHPGHPVHPGQPHPGMHEPPFPQGQPLGGQTFASTLLLSFSCAPLLKQHLLRTLSMTNEELTSLEPIIAQAWDHWDQQVCFCFFRSSSFPSVSLSKSSCPCFYACISRVFFAYPKIYAS